MDQHVLLPQIIYLLGSLTFVATLFFYLKIPTIIGFIVAGFAVGPFGFGLVSSVPGAKAVSEIAVLFLMFTIGLEFSLKKLKRYQRAFWGLGGLQVIVTFSLTLLICHHFLEFGFGKSAAIGFIITLSSTAIVMKLLSDSRESNSPYGNNSFGVLIFQDLMALPMMLSLPFLVEDHENSISFNYSAIGEGALKVVLLFASIAIAAKYLVPFLLQRVVRTRSREVFFFGILFLCLGTALAMEQVGLSLSLGAFFAGLIISESPFGRQATADFVPLRDNFLGIFFASIGMLIEPEFVMRNFHTIVGIFLLMSIGKFLIIFLSGLILRYPIKMIFLTSALLFQIGEFSLVILDLAGVLQILSPSEVQMLLSASVLSMMATPFVCKLAPILLFRKRSLLFLGRPEANPQGVKAVVDISKAAQAFTQRTEGEKKLEGFSQAVIIGFGVAGRHIAVALKDLDISYSIIDQNIDVVKKRKKMGENIFYGDATRAEVLYEAGIEHARLVVVVASGIEMTGAIVRAIRSIRSDVQIVIRLQYSLERDYFKNFRDVTIVVAEFETTIEILGKCLACFGASEKRILELMTQARDGFGQTWASRSDFLRRAIELPKWEVMSSIRPFQISETSYASGKTLVDLDLRSESGASVLAVFRSDLGTVIPDLDFEFAAGDTLHLISSPEGYEMALKILSSGPS